MIRPPLRFVWLCGVLTTAAAQLYGGPAAACVPCHRAETRAFADAAMTRALSAAGNSSVLRANPKLTARIGAYSYELARAGNEFVLTVSDGEETLRMPVVWAFGQGAVGQTFAFRHDGRWYESRVSWFAALRGLDLTLGAQNLTPHNLLEAAGRVLGPAETSQCFHCHATNLGKTPVPDLAGMIEGVQCERCHGASQAHLQAVRTGSPGGAMRKLGALSTEEMSDFCGQCHRTWSQIAAAGPRGIQNVRFQPYRLANSKCYDAADRRIRCTACHDPHRDLETAAGAYDARCTACHSAAAQATKASTRRCRVGVRHCVTCHMPRVDMPGAHREFTDHWIRIAQAGGAYPD
jgi:cytochrome c554/c'-like protein